MFTCAKREYWCAYLAYFAAGGWGSWIFICAHSRVCLLEQQTAKMAEGPDPGQTLAKCEFSSTFEMRKEKISSYNLVSLLYTAVYAMRCYFYFSTNSSSHAHSERALKCARFGRGLAFAWRQVGDESPRTCNNWKELPRRQWTLQSGDVESLPAKCQTSLMESGRWCPSANGRRHSCLEDTSKVLQALHGHW